MPNTIDDHALQGKGVCEWSQLEQAFKADALIDLCHLLQKTNQSDLTQGGQVLLQLRHVLRALDKFQGHLDPVAELEWVEVNLKPLIQILQRLSSSLNKLDKKNVISEPNELFA